MSGSDMSSVSGPTSRSSRPTWALSASTCTPSSSSLAPLHVGHQRVDEGERFNSVFLLNLR